jgi:hypothetical protein
MIIIDITAQPTYAVSHNRLGMLLGEDENGEPAWSGSKPVDVHDALAFKTARSARNFIAMYLEHNRDERGSSIRVWRVLPKPRPLSPMPSGTLVSSIPSDPPKDGA